MNASGTFKGGALMDNPRWGDCFCSSWPSKVAPQSLRDWSFCCVFVLSRCFWDFSVGVWAFVMELSKISSFFFENNKIIYLNHLKKTKQHIVGTRFRIYPQYLTLVCCRVVIPDLTLITHIWSERSIEGWRKTSPLGTSRALLHSLEPVRNLHIEY